MILQAAGLNRRFDGVHAVRDVSFSVMAGEMVGLIGPNGAGKTTLFNLLSGALRPNGGRIVVDGEDVTSATPERRCELGVSRTFQHPRVFAHMTVEENVLIGALARTRSVREARGQARGVLEELGLRERLNTPTRLLPLALRKQVELARALATGPKILLLDELLSGLDGAEVRGSLGLLRAIHERGIALIVIEHLLPVLLSTVERVMVLHEGQLIADATPATVVRDPAVVRAYLGERYVSTA